MKVIFTDGNGFTEKVTSPAYPAGKHPIGAPPAMLPTSFLVSNFNRNKHGGVDVGGDANGTDWTQGFSVDSGTRDYTLTGVYLDVITLGNRINVAVHAQSTGNSNNPTESSLYDLTGPTFVSTGVQKFTAPAGAMLERGTNYFVVMRGGSNVTTIGRTDTRLEDGGGISGWSISDQARRQRTDRVGGWFGGSGDVIRMRVTGRALNPATGEPTISGSTWVGQEVAAAIGHHRRHQRIAHDIPG